MSDSENSEKLSDRYGADLDYVSDLVSARDSTRIPRWNWLRLIAILAILISLLATSTFIWKSLFPDWCLDACVWVMFGLSGIAVALHQLPMLKTRPDLPGIDVVD